MAGEAEYSGRTVDDAVAEAVRDLGTERDQLAIEVLSAGSRGLFGLGSEPARVRVSRTNDVPAPSGSPRDPGRSRESASGSSIDAPPPVQQVREEETAVATVDADIDPDLPDRAAEVLQELLQHMNFDAQVAVRSTDDPIMLEISGENLGVLIGRRGDNLAALQFMVNLIVSQSHRHWPRVVVDVENYRARREESLRGLADRIGSRVRRTRRPYTLEAMPAGDRRIIHLALREDSEIETYSVGDGIARRVVVAPIREPQDA
ncbi:MAG: RNA-binding cell elongation regulator Jag/EloR [Chloroflexota bacterium]